MHRGGLFLPEDRTLPGLGASLGWVRWGMETPSQVLTGPVLLLQVELGPPILVLTPKEKMLSVNATYQLPSCTPALDLQYEVQFWKEGARNKVGSPAPSPPQRAQMLLILPLPL